MFRGVVWDLADKDLKNLINQSVRSSRRTLLLPTHLSVKLRISIGSCSSVSGSAISGACRAISASRGGLWSSLVSKMSPPLLLPSFLTSWEMSLASGTAAMLGICIVFALDLDGEMGLDTGDSRREKLVIRRAFGRLGSSCELLPDIVLVYRRAKGDITVCSALRKEGWCYKYRAKLFVTWLQKVDAMS